jgi:hypothetical protein
MTDQQESTVEHEIRMAELADQVRGSAPRPFVVYGIDNEYDDEFVGWGWDFPDEARTFVYCPDDRTTYSGNSVERALRHFGRGCDARLMWLGPPVDALDE